MDSRLACSSSNFFDCCIQSARCRDLQNAKCSLDFDAVVRHAGIKPALELLKGHRRPRHQRRLLQEQPRVREGHRVQERGQLAAMQHLCQEQASPPKQHCASNWVRLLRTATMRDVSCAVWRSKTGMAAAHLLLSRSSGSAWVWSSRQSMNSMASVGNGWLSTSARIPYAPCRRYCCHYCRFTSCLS